MAADPANYIDFLADARFRKTEGADTYEGVYTYNRTGTHLATVGLESDDGETCTYELAFASRTAGTLSFTCDEGAVGESTWYLVELNAGETTTYGTGEDTTYGTSEDTTYGTSEDTTYERLDDPSLSGRVRFFSRPLAAVTFDNTIINGVLLHRQIQWQTRTD